MQTQTQNQNETSPTSLKNGSGEVCKRFVYRDTRMGAKTITLVIIDGEILEPTAEYRSRSGTHGEDIYCVPNEKWEKAIIVTLCQSNSGKRYVSVNVDELREIVEDMWIHHKLHPDEVAEGVAKLQRAKERCSTCNLKTIFKFNKKV